MRNARNWRKAVSVKTRMKQGFGAHRGSVPHLVHHDGASHTGPRPIQQSLPAALGILTNFFLDL